MGWDTASGLKVMTLVNRDRGFQSRAVVRIRAGGLSRVGAVTRVGSVAEVHCDSSGSQCTVTQVAARAGPFRPAAGPAAAWAWQVGNGIELDTVGRQFEPRLPVAPLWCDLGRSRTVMVIKLRRISAFFGAFVYLCRSRRPTN